MSSSQQPHPATAPHERGVSRNREGFPGTSVFRVHSCRGVLLARTEILDALVDEQLESDHWTFLEKHCPTGHGGLCPADLLRIGKQLETNRAVLQERHLRLR